MELIPVESSMLSAIGYDAEAKELVAVFRSGGTWRYRGVPQETYEGLLVASSKGSYMHAHVLNVFEDYRVSR
ncbi:MAG: KTSC domain-containing protein [Planctomycetes bacterium]|nr:KTSC domain-containing protein [Planctomycetota bacterium]